MHCTNCGTEIPGDARFCPGCGAATAVRTNTAAPIAARAPDPKASGNPLAKMSGCAFALLLVGGLWVAAELTGSGKDPAKAPATAAELKATGATAAAKAKACDAGLADLARAGVLKGRPARNRIEVEEDLWAQLPAQEKRLFAAAVRCSARGGTERSSGGIDLDDYGEVDGYRSGKELAMATSAGVTLD